MKKYVYIKGISYEKIVISLTEKDSHEVLIEPGQGSFSIGVKGISKDYVDAWVNKDDVINWGCFNRFNNGYGAYKWPRFFYYTGNDTRFIEWSKKREIESFTWYPQKDMDVNFKDSNIYNLCIHEGNHKVKLLLDDKIDCLDLYGNINNYIIKKCDKVPSLRFYPKYEKNISSYQLPKFECFKVAKELLIEVGANVAPFDCSSLLRFPNLEQLYLIGNMTNLSALKELKHLKKLGFKQDKLIMKLPIS